MNCVACLGSQSTWAKGWLTDNTLTRPYSNTQNSIVHALICTRVDSGNSIFAGLSSLNTSKLQSILNSAAHRPHRIGSLLKFSHIYLPSCGKTSTVFLCQRAFNSKSQHLSATLWSDQLLYTFRPCAPWSLHSLVDPPSAPLP